MDSDYLKSIYFYELYECLEIVTKPIVYQGHFS